MSDRNRALPLAACILLLMVAGQVAGDSPAGPGLAANGPVELAGSAAVSAEEGEPARPIEDPSDETAAATAMTDSDGEPGDQYAGERKALGIPNGLFSTRPAETEEPAGSLLSSLDPTQNGVVRVALALALVMALLLGFRSVLRRSGHLLVGGVRPSGVVEVLARYPVARRQHLVLLKVGRRVVLLHQGSGTMSALTSITDADEVAHLLASMEAGARQKEAARFRSILKSYDHEHAGKTDHFGQGPGRSGNDGDQVIDLTGGSLKGIGGWLGKRRSTA